MGQHHVDHQHKDEGVPGLRAQHALLCYVVTLLYGSETWTIYNTPAKSADSTPSTWAAFGHHASHRRESLACSPCSVRGNWAGLAMSRLGRMKAGSITKDILYGELATGTRRADVSKMQFLKEKDSKTENYPTPRPSR